MSDNVYVDQVVTKHPEYPRLLRLLAEYHKKPGSLIFAPLAETYRKVALVDDAIRIYEEGLKSYPTYSSAIVGLSRCFFDKRDFEAARRLLLDRQGLVYDNVAGVGILARSCEELGIISEAIEHFERLKFLLPFDEKITKRLGQLKETFQNVDPEKAAKVSKPQAWEPVAKNWTMTSSSKMTLGVQENRPAQSQPVASRISDVNLDARERKIAALTKILEKLEQKK